ncbi:hypothetical protein FGO68_gene7685 [Halteria grandinella]|uniref:Uncharacterized protein n=1 Tax=Halteria grandinella TaxID=5974 RepID=A0A8J8T1E7_HALGN|nr:hypothetical protein FGO68_gene7685 [Halteria grandinella]
MLYGISRLVRSAKTTLKRQKTLYNGDDSGYFDVEDSDEEEEIYQNSRYVGSFKEISVQIIAETRQSDNNLIPSNSLVQNVSQYDEKYLQKYAGVNQEERNKISIN